MPDLIASEQLERAETTLQVIYGQRIERQMVNMQVDQDAWFSFLEQSKKVVKDRYPDAWTSMDPRMEPALNTLFTHIFFVGLITGRNQERMIV